MTQVNCLKLAKKGNPQAIATVLNYRLKPKGINVVKTSLTEGCFQVLLEPASLEHQTALVSFIYKTMLYLKPEAINYVKIYGRITNTKKPIWHQELELDLDTIKSSKPTKKTQVAIGLSVLTGGVIILAWLEFPFALPIAIVLGGVDIYLFLTSEDYQKEKEHQAIDKEVTAEREKIDQDFLATMSQAHLKDEEQQYLQLLDPQLSPVKKFKTNLAYLALLEFKQVQAVLSPDLGSDYLNDLVDPVRTIVQDFNVSDDYNVCQPLTQLIEKLLFCHEVYIECLKFKDESKKKRISFMAISSKSELGKLLQEKMPNIYSMSVSELTEKKLANILTADLAARYYDFNTVVNTATENINNYLNFLEKILSVACN